MKPLCSVTFVNLDVINNVLFKNSSKASGPENDKRRVAAKKKRTHASRANFGFLQIKK